MDILTSQALDERARAAPLDDKAILDELVNSLLDRNAADAVLLTHLALQRKLFPCLIDTLLNLIAQLICYFLVFYHNTYSSIINHVFSFSLYNIFIILSRKRYKTAASQNEEPLWDIHPPKVISSAGSGAPRR